jgi:hypothetical protein
MLQRCCYDRSLGIDEVQWIPLRLDYQNLEPIAFLAFGIDEDVAIYALCSNLRFQTIPYVYDAWEVES